jgi:hypothetical protein
MAAGGRRRVMCISGSVQSARKGVDEKAIWFSKWGKQVTEKVHEADESDDSCYCNLDVCVYGVALLRLV